MRLIVLPMALMLVNGTAFSQPPNNQKNETRVIIRGGNLSTEKPLVIIDGKSGGDLQSITPESILSMDVLKGEAATKLYGTDGKNGVIIITTKSKPVADTLPTGNKRVERIVTVNTIRKSDGGGDTTIIRADSITVQVDGQRIVINGMPYMGAEGRIFKGFPLPDIEGTLWENKSAPKIGLSVQDAEDEKGVVVLSTVSGGAGAKAGILANDRIVSIDQISVNDVDELKQALERTRDKRSVMVKLMRGKKEVNVELVYPRELKRAEL